MTKDESIKAFAKSIAAPGRASIRVTPPPPKSERAA